MRRNALFLVSMGLGTAGCGAGWRQPAHLTPGPWAPRQQVQVWSEGRAERWHAVVVGEDSISGAPFLQPPECDSCRLALPLARVDSVRVGKPAAGFWKTFGLVVGVPMVLMIVYCRAETCFTKS